MRYVNMATCPNRERFRVLSEGDKLGIFEIIGPLGKGGMGEVFDPTAETRRSRSGEGQSL